MTLRFSQTPIEALLERRKFFEFSACSEDMKAHCVYSTTYHIEDFQGNLSISLQNPEVGTVRLNLPRRKRSIG